jgi:hypothetical protein
MPTNFCSTIVTVTVRENHPVLIRTSREKIRTVEKLREPVIQHSATASCRNDFYHSRWRYPSDNKEALLRLAFALR